MAGTLYVVATPIGNLEDITLRALRVLRECDLIACEDTRWTAKLLAHYGIETPTISYHEHNEATRSVELVERLRSGSTVCLVSDAGTPLLSDPGYRLIRAAVEGDIPVVSIPGPSAAVAALTCSGLPSDEFHFGGFLPPKSGQRRKVLSALEHETATLIFYEAPHRIVESLEDIEATLGARAVVVARELTKLHEEILRGTPTEIARTLRQRPSVKGEFTIVIGRGAPRDEGGSLTEAVEAAMQQGLSRMEAMKIVARRRRLSKREVYDALERGLSRPPRQPPRGS